MVLDTSKFGRLTGDLSTRALCAKTSQLSGETSVGNKRIYLLSILYITAYAVIVKFIYPELEITALATVIALLGFASAVATNYLLPMPNNNQGKDDE